MNHMAKVLEVVTLPPTDPIFQEPWTVRPMPARSPEPGKAEEKRPVEEESGSEDAADAGRTDESQ